MTIRFYHASPRRFRHGDILTGGHDGGYGYAHSNVCMTDGPAPHGTVAHKAVEENWLVYEVEPVGSVSYVEGNHEFQSKQAKVLRCIGRVAGFAHKPTANAQASKWSGKTEYFVSYPAHIPRKGVRSDRPMNKYVWRGQEADQRRNAKLRILAGNPNLVI